MTPDQFLKASVQMANRERGETLVPQGGLSVSLLPEVVARPVALTDGCFVAGGDGLPLLSWSLE